MLGTQLLLSKAVSFFFLLFLWTSSLYSEDFESWNNISLDFNLNQKYFLKMDNAFRFNNQGADFYHFHSSVILDYKWQSYLVVGGKLRFAFEKEVELEKKDELWQPEIRPRAHFTFKAKFKSWKVADRNRFEYRYFISADDDIVRYRNTLSLGYLLKFSKFSLQPFISDEIFVEFNSTGFNRNRIHSGIKFKLAGNCTLTPLYFIQMDFTANQIEYTHVFTLKGSIQIE